LTVASIATDFHAPAFTNNLARFLQSKSIILRLVPAGNSTFPVYKRLSLSLPRILEANSSDLKDTVRAIKASPLQNTPKGVKPAKAGQFDTVLVRVSPRRANEGPTDGESYIYTASRDAIIPLYRTLCWTCSGHLPHSRGFRPISRPRRLY
jgi:hypothetical protein